MELITDLIKTLLIDLGIDLDIRETMPSKHDEWMDFCIEQADYEWFTYVSDEGTHCIGRRRRKT